MPPVNSESHMHTLVRRCNGNWYTKAITSSRSDADPWQRLLKRTEDYWSFPLFRPPPPSSLCTLKVGDYKVYSELVKWQCWCRDPTFPRQTLLLHKNNLNSTFVVLPNVVSENNPVFNTSRLDSTQLLLSIAAECTRQQGTEIMFPTVYKRVCSIYNIYSKCAKYTRSGLTCSVYTVQTQ